MIVFLQFENRLVVKWVFFFTINRTRVFYIAKENQNGIEEL